MANIKSAKKRILQNARRAEINKFRLSRIRTGIKISIPASQAKRKIFQENIFGIGIEISRAASKGFIKKNTASRMVSKLSEKLKLIQSNFFVCIDSDIFIS